MPGKLPSQPAPQRDNNPVEQYYLYDASFSVIALLNNQGSPIERYRYSPYGQRSVMNPTTFATTGSTSAYGNDRGFQGLLHDAESGLIENRHRMLDPLTGRFLQRDPLGYPDGMNAYAGYHVMWGGVDAWGLYVTPGYPDLNKYKTSSTNTQPQRNSDSVDLTLHVTTNPQAAMKVVSGDNFSERIPTWEYSIIDIDTGLEEPYGPIEDDDCYCLVSYPAYKSLTYENHQFGVLAQNYTVELRGTQKQTAKLVSDISTLGTIRGFGDRSNVLQTFKFLILAEKKLNYDRYGIELISATNPVLNFYGQTRIRRHLIGIGDITRVKEQSYYEVVCNIDWYEADNLRIIMQKQQNGLVDASIYNSKSASDKELHEAWDWAQQRYEEVKKEFEGN